MVREYSDTGTELSVYVVLYPMDRPLGTERDDFGIWVQLGVTGPEIHLTSSGSHVQTTRFENRVAAPT